MEFKRLRMVIYGELEKAHLSIYRKMSGYLAATHIGCLHLEEKMFTQSYLVNLHTNIWDEDLMNQILWKVDARRVLAIPLSSHGMAEFLVWHLTKMGTFSVCIAYVGEWGRQYGHKVNH
jgi:hypothetical protein